MLFIQTFMLGVPKIVEICYNNFFINYETLSFAFGIVSKVNTLFNHLRHYVLKPKTFKMRCY